MTASTDLAHEVTGLVLAGGRSTRFGDADEQKAVATIGRQTLLGRVVEAVTAATTRPPVVAVRSDDQRDAYAEAVSADDVSFAVDDGSFDGPLAGLFGGIDTVDSQWLFCCGCDMPLLSSAAIQWLVDELCGRSSPSEGRPDAVAIRHPDGTTEPLHTLYRRASVARARAELPRSAGPRALLETLDRVVTLPVEATPPRVPIEESTTNVNTRTDLETAVQRLLPNQ